MCTEFLLRITLHGRHVFRRDPVLSRVWHLDAEVLQPLQPLIWPSPPAPPGRSAAILLKAVRLHDSQRVSTLHPKLMPPSSFNFTSQMAFIFNITEEVSNPPRRSSLQQDTAPSRDLCTPTLQRRCSYSASGMAARNTSRVRRTRAGIRAMLERDETRRWGWRWVEMYS